MHRARDAETAGLGQRLQARRHVDAVAVEVTVRLGHDIADIDAEAQPELPLGGQAGVAAEHGTLDLDRTGDGAHGARELDQEAVTHALDDPPMGSRDAGIDQFPAKRLQAAQGAGLVHAHEPAVAHDIGDQDRC